MWIDLDYVNNMEHSFYKKFASYKVIFLLVHQYSLQPKFTDAETVLS